MAIPRRAFLGLVGCLLGGVALAQTNTYSPYTELSVSNQAFNVVAVTPGSSTIPVTRALYNGNASACTIVIQPNGAAVGTFISFQNVQPGEVLPVQAVVVTASTTCSNVLALY